MIDLTASAGLAAKTPAARPDDAFNDTLDGVPNDVSSDADSVQAHFHAGIAADDIEQVFHLKRAQPTLQAFTALFHGGADGVLIRLLVLRELACDSATPAFTRADINQKLNYLLPESLETVLMRLRSHALLAWEPQGAVYRLTPMARNILSALDTLLAIGQGGDDAEMGFLLSQVAGAQAVGGISVEQLKHLLGRLVELTEEFRDAIASGSEFRLRASQAKWHLACDWVEKGSLILRAITSSEQADGATQQAAQAIGRAQSALLNMQGMFSRALNQIERQRVHLGQSGLSTTDVQRWLLAHADLASLAEGAIDRPLVPLFGTPAEMIDVAETELQAERLMQAGAVTLPAGQDAPLTLDHAPAMQVELDDWLARLSDFANPGKGSGVAGQGAGPVPLQESLLPASFAIASYRASLLPLLGDAAEARLQGTTAQLARLPIAFRSFDDMVALGDPHVAAMSVATLAFDFTLDLTPALESGPADE